MGLKMKFKLLVVSAVVTLSGCSSPPVHKLSGYDGPEAMHRKEIVQASRECTDEKMRPKVEYVTQKINSGGRVLIPINVHCDPVEPPGGYHAPKHPPGYYPQSQYYVPHQSNIYGSIMDNPNAVIIPSGVGSSPIPHGTSYPPSYGRRW